MGAGTEAAWASRGSIGLTEAALPTAARLPQGDPRWTGVPAAIKHSRLARGGESLKRRSTV